MQIIERTLDQGTEVGLPVTEKRPTENERCLAGERCGSEI